MTETTERPMIYTKLAAVMADVEGVAKRDRNTHQNFAFRGIDAVVNAVGPVLRKHAVIVVPNVVDVVYDKVQTTGNKPATACRVRVDYIFYAEDGSNVVTTVAAEAWDSGDKAAPKAMSVAFRIALLQALALPTDEPDPDSQTYEQARPAVTSGVDVSRLQAAFAAADLSGPDNSDGRIAIFSTVLGRETKGGDLTTEETDRVLADLANRSPATPEQEKMLAESLGATPVEGPRTAAARVGAERRSEEPPTDHTED